jgi:hypothetical protein
MNAHVALDIEKIPHCGSLEIEQEHMDLADKYSKLLSPRGRARKSKRDSRQPLKVRPSSYFEKILA